MDPQDWLEDQLEEAGEALDDLKRHFVDERAEALQGLREHMEHEVEGTVRLYKYVRQTDEFRVLAPAAIEIAIAVVTKKFPKSKIPLGALDFGAMLDRAHQEWRDEYKREYEPEPAKILSLPGRETNLDRRHKRHLKIHEQEAFNDEYERLSRIHEQAARASYQPGDWDLELLPNQRLADLQELGFVSGDVMAHTLLLGDTLEHDLAPALTGAVDSLRPTDIAFGEMNMGYDDLRWVSDDVLEGLTVNAAAMSGAVTPWALGMSEMLTQRRREIEAMLRQPAPVARSDSPPGGGSSGGGLSWDEGVDLYQERSGETAENIEWMRERPDDIAESGPNAGSTFQDIVRDAVKNSGETSLFAMGGMVPGSIGAPVPAVVHGGERIIGGGNTGGVPINLEVHVHGTVISEGDLAKNVRDGLMRRLA